MDKDVNEMPDHNRILQIDTANQTLHLDLSTSSESSTFIFLLRKLGIALSIMHIMTIARNLDNERYCVKFSV